MWASWAQDGLHLLLDSIEHIVKDEHRRTLTSCWSGGGGTSHAARSSCQKRARVFCELYGQVPHDHVGNYLSSADIGVAPDPKTAMNDKSTMIKIFEYMAYGCR